MRASGSSKSGRARPPGCASPRTRKPLSRGWIRSSRPERSSAAHARLIARDPELGELFEAALAEGSSARASSIANWLTGSQEARSVAPAGLASLAGMVDDGKLTNQAGRKVLALMAEGGGDPAEIAEREGLGAMADSGELDAIVDRALEAHPAEAEKVKAGAMQAIGPIIGFVMRETKGAADGKEVTRLVREKLGT